VFEATVAPAAAPRTRGGAGGGAEARARIAELSRDLEAKEEYLQSSLEEQETTNEELKSSNEEMQSVNEELQSSNEELETSKEELQSVNEELATVNNELQTKVGELSQTNNDMINLMAGTGVGTIFVGHRLNILRFTPAATQVINLIPTDVGRPVGHIVSNLLNYNHLVEDVQGVLDSLAIKEVEVQSKSLAWYLLRIRPYRTQENVIEGAVITFVDITETRRLRQAERLAVVVRDASDAITLQDLEGRTLAWNPAAEQLYGWTEAEALALNVRDRLPKEERAEALERLRALGHAEALEAVRARRLTRDGRVLDVVVTATVVRNREGAAYALATTERVVGPAPGGDPPG
jgi:two-component system CheB/CheR fusion protein